MAEPRVLLIDDGSETCAVSALLLTAAGICVELARVDSETLSRVRESQADAIVVSIGSPGSDGGEMLGLLRNAARARGISVVVVASRATTGYRPEPEHMPTVGSFSELVAELRKIMARRQSDLLAS